MWRQEGRRGEDEEGRGDSKWVGGRPRGTQTETTGGAGSAAGWERGGEGELGEEGWSGR